MHFGSALCHMSICVNYMCLLAYSLIVCIFTVFKRLQPYRIYVTAFTWPLSFQALYSWSCPTLLSYGYNGILVALKVVSWWAAKFKPLVFSVFDFPLSRVPNTFVPMILYNVTYAFCLHNYVVKSYR
jgi:hypothetical protein